MTKRTALRPLMLLFATLLLTHILLATGPTDLRAEPENGGVVTEILDGTRTNPDPLWEEILLLQEDGLVTAYRILDSVPVQISVTGPSLLISELRRKYRR